MACWRASLSRTGDAAGVEGVAAGEEVTGVVLAAGLETGDGDAAAGVDAGAAAGAAVIGLAGVLIEEKSSTEIFRVLLRFPMHEDRLYQWCEYEPCNYCQ
jgi:hypothetical protein